MSAEIAQQKSDETADGDRWVVVDLRALLRTNLGLELRLADLAKGPVEVISTRLGTGADPIQQTATDFGGTLPIDEEAMAFVRALKDQGNRLALISEVPMRVLEEFNARSNLFDRLIGAPDGAEWQAHDKHKATLAAFDALPVFVGASDRDVPMWQAATGAVTINARPKLAADVDAMSKDAHHITTTAKTKSQFAAMVRAVRPHQWLKNILVFLPILAAHETDPIIWATAAVAYAAFCLTASSVYILNDLLDLEADRAHPRKRKRPFASGALSLEAGLLLAPGLLLAGIVLALIFVRPLFLVVLLGYYLTTVAYSFVLKREVIVDIITLGGLYTVRILAGGVATMTELSPWMLAFSGFFFFSLAAVKRQAELVDLVNMGKETASGRAYRASDLAIVTPMAIAAGFTAVLILASYISSTDVGALYARIKVLWLVSPVLLFWISRVIMLTHRGQMTDDPIVFAARDIVSWACLILTLAIAIFARS